MVLPGPASTGTEDAQPAPTGTEDARRDGDQKPPAGRDTADAAGRDGLGPEPYDHGGSDRERVDEGVLDRGGVSRSGLDRQRGDREWGDKDWQDKARHDRERVEDGSVDDGGVLGGGPDRVRADREPTGQRTESGRGLDHGVEPDGTGGQGADDEAGVGSGEGEERATPAGTTRRLLPAGARSPAGLLIGLLIGLLGFALAVQVRSNTSTSGLPAARQEDLVRILDDLSSREDRLRRQIAELEAARTRLTTTGDRSTAALEEARKRSAALGILAGTLPAQGPGVVLTLTDPERRLAAEDMLDAVEELRAAGAEAMQVGGVRIGLDSAFTATDRGIAVDGVPLTTPYQILAIGEPQTLATAMEIPGGVADTVRRAGGEARIEERNRVVIRALRPLREPQYSRPSDGGR